MELGAISEDATILAIENVSLSFGGVKALADVSLSVPRGSVVGVIGPNGAGKTSLFNCISGVYRPDSGRIILDGVDLVGRRPHEIAGMGLSRTFQNIQMIPDLTVHQNVLLGRHVRQQRNLGAALMWWGPGRREELHQGRIVDGVLAELGISHLRDRKASQLPYGQQRLVEIARSVSSEPRALVLDEPTSGMDRRERDEVAHVIRRLRDERGMTQVIVEHDVSFIAAVTDFAVVLNFGQLIASGTTGDVLSAPVVIEAYMGLGT